MKCIEHVPAIAAHTKIVPGEVKPADNTPGVHVLRTVDARVVLGIGPSGATTWAGTWDKVGLRRFGQALLQLSEYMSE